MPLPRPEVARHVRDVGRQLRQEQRAASARRAAGRRFESEVRRRAKQLRALERQLAVARATLVAGRPAQRRRSGYAAWLDEPDARLPMTRADLHSRTDELASSVVAGGGGMEAVIEATGWRTENVLGVIDPVIVVQALDNDAAAAVAEPVRDRLRRLVPDAELVCRPAGGETLRRLAADYG